LDRHVDVVRDGRAWRIGTQTDVAWIIEGTKGGRGIGAAVPALFSSYATVWDSNEDSVTTTTHEHALIAHLSAHTTAQRSWWLGFLDTGAHDIVFADAPRVTLYWDWHYVLVEAGPAQALSWRTGHMRSGHGTLPDLMFPADRSWLVSALWDDEWTCVGGPQQLIDSLERDALVHATAVQPDENPRPPDLPF
jgi:hypothetical protein